MPYLQVVPALFTLQQAHVPACTTTGMVLCSTTTSMAQVKSQGGAQGPRMCCWWWAWELRQTLLCGSEMRCISTCCTCATTYSSAWSRRYPRCVLVFPWQPAAHTHLAHQTCHRPGRAYAAQELSLHDCACDPPCLVGLKLPCRRMWCASMGQQKPRDASPTPCPSALLGLTATPC